MRRRTAMLYAFGIILLVTAGVALFPSSEPSYGGRTLSKWVLDDALIGIGGQEEMRTVSNAIVHIGPQAVPYLVKWIAYERPGWNPALTQYLGSNFGKYKFTRKIQDPLMRRWQLAEASVGAFSVLGAAADPAAPELTQILNRPGPPTDRAPMRALVALARIGPKGLPPLMAVLADPSRSNRWFIAFSITAMGTNARPAIPVLLRCLKDPDPALPPQALHALLAARAEPSLLVPALVECFEDPKMRKTALTTVGGFGPAASNAVSALRKAFQDPDAGIRELATNALRHIDPTALPSQ